MPTLLGWLLGYLAPFLASLLLVSFCVRRWDTSHHRLLAPSPAPQLAHSSAYLSPLGAVPEDVMEPTSGKAHLTNGAVVDACTYDGTCIYQKRKLIQLHLRDDS